MLCCQVIQSYVPIGIGKMKSKIRKNVVGKTADKFWDVLYLLDVTRPDYGDLLIYWRKHDKGWARINL